MRLADAAVRVLRPATVRNARHVVTAVRTFRNWPRFVTDYVTASGASRVYRWRNGLELETLEAIDAATIGVVFLRREYGTIGDGWTVIDVGANIGAFAVYAAHAGAHVFAYEPMFANHEQLLRNVRRNSLRGSVAPFALGVAGRRGQRRLHIAGNDTGHSLITSNAGGAGDVAIDCVALEDILRDNAISHCDLLKLDCEGAEFEILEAAAPSVLQRISRIRLEWHPGFDLDELIAMLTAQGFRVLRRQAEEGGRGMLWLERSAQPAGGASAASNSSTSAR